MLAARSKCVLDWGRRTLAWLATNDPRIRRFIERVGRELVRAAETGRALAGAREAGIDDLYGGAYFGRGRDESGDRAGISGYARYDRVASNADIAGWLLWRNFPVRRSLDVGCATGYLVEVLRELGVDAEGCDVSPYAVEHAVPGARGHIRVGNLFAGLPWSDGEFELVTVLEMLEHLPPDQVPAALSELRRICGGFLYATIPSFGANSSGPDGHFEGKVRPERLLHFASLGDDYEGPVPFEDLAVDAEGKPVEGHLCIASFSWWTERFAEAGFVRCVEIERRLYRDVAPAALAPYWNLYVFRIEAASDALAAPRQPHLSLGELGLHHPLLES